MTIGLPRALLYYKYGTLWEHFFEVLGIETLISPKTNREILQKGIDYAVDESCLPLKIYLGHIDYLKNRVDYILVPRIASVRKGEKVCTNFMAIYDLIENTYCIKTLHYNIDVEHHYDEIYAFISLAKQLGISKYRAVKSYLLAKERVKEIQQSHFIKQQSHIKTDQLKILIASHPYNLYDELIGIPILKFLKENHVTAITTDSPLSLLNHSSSKTLSKDLYWSYNKEIFSNLLHYYKQIDGIILLSTFPCGPDSLCNEIIIQKIKDVPIITLIVDELNNDSGLMTRLESFIDILKEKKEKSHHESKNY